MKEQIIKEVSNLIRAAKKDQAIDKLIEFLETDSKYNQLKRIAKVADARNQKLRKDERQNKITQEEASIESAKINDQVLSLLDDLEAGNLNPVIPETATTTINKWPFIFGGMLLVLLAFMLGMWYMGFIGKSKRPQKKKDQTPIVEMANCPDFAPVSQFKILLFPFKNAITGGEGNTEVLIQNRLEDYSSTNNISEDISIQIFDQFDIESDYPNKQNARTFGLDCKADMVIWGSVIPDEKFVTLNYCMVDTSIIQQGGTESEELKSYASIVQDGSITEDLENELQNALSYLFGIAANKSNHADVAIDVLNKIDSKNEETDMVIADSYAKMEDDEGAIKIYEEVLKKDPDNQVANFNAGVLHAKKGEHPKAIQYYSRSLEINAEDIHALKKRGESYEKTNDKKKAQKDYKKANQIKPGDKDISMRLENLNQVLGSNQAIAGTIKPKDIDVSTSNKPDKPAKQFQPADIQVRKTPTNINSQNIRAVDLTTAQNRLKSNPKDTSAYFDVIKGLLQKGDSKKAKVELKKAKNLGIDQAVLLKRLDKDLIKVLERGN